MRKYESPITYYSKDMANVKVYLGEDLSFWYRDFLPGDLPAGT
jgi:hypothetical protein